MSYQHYEPHRNSFINAVFRPSTCCPLEHVTSRATDGLAKSNLWEIQCVLFKICFSLDASLLSFLVQDVKYSKQQALSLCAGTRFLHSPMK